MHKFYIDGVLLPIAPSALKVTINDKDQEIELANGGTMSVLNQPGLTKYSFTFRAPNTRYPFAKYGKGYMEAPAFLSLLSNLKMSQKPFMFKVIRGNTYVDYRDINTQVSLVDYTITEDAENNNDYIIDVELKEYVTFNTIKTVNGNPVSSESEDKIIIDETTNRDDTTIVEEYKEYYLGANDYIIEEGDTFQSISQKFFGSMNYAEAIAEHNGMTYTTDVLPAGEVINLNREKIEELAKTTDEVNHEKEKDDLTIVGGTVAGMAAGAAIGSIVPGVGTALGAGIGGVVGFLGGLLLG